MRFMLRPLLSLTVSAFLTYNSTSFAQNSVPVELIPYAEKVEWPDIWTATPTLGNAVKILTLSRRLTVIRSAACRTSTAKAERQTLLLLRPPGWRTTTKSRLGLEVTKEEFMQRAAGA